ncbi:hypothetical protein EV294_1011082 [Paenibacillus sp. BK033]|nr:hypothetical protein EV294_1011082 [Paenibacillus sp. BK033]
MKGSPLAAGFFSCPVGGGRNRAWGTGYLLRHLLSGYGLNNMQPWLQYPDKGGRYAPPGDTP